MTDNIISFNGSKITESEDKPELTDIEIPPGDPWQVAAEMVVKDKALWGGILFVTEDGDIGTVYVGADRVSFRGLIESIRDGLRGQLREDVEEC